MPSEYCDIVMKGGITSGVVYPLAITGLAEKYKFKNIGGTSAGAIAAVLTAAAEYGKREGDINAFSVLEALPTELKQNNFLLNLFQPTPDAARIFKVFLFVLKFQSKIARVLAAVLALLGQFWYWAVLGAVLGAIIPIYFGLSNHLSTAVMLILASVWVLLGVVVGVVIGAIRTIASALGKNGFGMCSGLATSKSPALTEWLHTKIQKAAGRDPADDPLTFGDLKSAKMEVGEPSTSNGAINLQTVTTSLTEGRPVTLPMRNHEYYFDPDELSRLFPTQIINWLKKPPHPHTPSRTVKSAEGKNLIPLPDADETPILVAARMSLSFPILLQAVPLYRVDFTLDQNNKPESSTVMADRCWFSDGGICSNFPMQFFDSPLPRWPTFGINLKSPHPDHDKTEEDMVWLPTNPTSGSQVAWNKFDSGNKGEGTIFGFFGAIINTMQNWRDNLQSTAPGYRDRIVHISLRDNEGGLNLNMPEDLIDRLSKRGILAGQRLKTEFSFCDHLWLRYRLTMCSLQKYLASLSSSWSQQFPQQDCGKKYINNQAVPPHYPGKDYERAFLLAALQSLDAASGQWQGDACAGAPKPPADLRGQPKF